jgi:Protein-tyrosine phosphatase
LFSFYSNTYKIVITVWASSPSKLSTFILPVSRRFTDHVGVASQDTSSGTLRPRPSFLERLHIRRSPSPNSKSGSTSRANSVSSLTLSRSSSQGRSTPNAASSGEGDEMMGDQPGAQTDTMSHQILGVSTPPASSQRPHSRDGNLSESSPLTTPGTNGNSHYANNFASQPTVKVPWYLNQQRAQIQKRFQDLEWHQRFRLQHGYIHPDTSPFRMDRSDTVISRNRYGNIQPWDPSRVRLRMPIGGSDYINASPISLKSHASTPSTRPDATPASPPDNYSSAIKLSEMRYIATQGPKDDQFAHFWNMVMQETVGPVGVIVMLTQCYEGIREKCSQYFPQDLESPVLVLDAGELAAAEAEAEIGDPFVSPQSCKRRY